MCEVVDHPVAGGMFMVANEHIGRRSSQGLKVFISEGHPQGTKKNKQGHTAVGIFSAFSSNDNGNFLRRFQRAIALSIDLISKWSKDHTVGILQHAA